MDHQTDLDVYNRYAAAQALHGLHLLQAHRRDANDYCLRCKQQHPCTQRRRGANLIVHFGHWSCEQVHADSAIWLE